MAEGRVKLGGAAAASGPAFPPSLDTGSGAVAYVEVKGGTYEQRRLQLGRRGDDLVEIISGVAEGERVVTTAAFLLDAQAQLTREAGTDRPRTLPSPPRNL